MTSETATLSVIRPNLRHYDCQLKFLCRYIMFPLPTYLRSGIEQSVKRLATGWMAEGSEFESP
jgi:hypothetical protein